MKNKETIFRIKHGSHLYGTNTEKSDSDFKEVHLPSGRDILLQRAKAAYDQSTPKPDGAKNQAGDIDLQTFAVHKLFEMLWAGDIIGMELIFAPKQNIELITSQYQFILENKNIFLSRKVDGYVGYCRQQANKYGIRGSRVAAARATKDFFSQWMMTCPNVKVGEFHSQLQTLVEETEHCSIIDIPNGVSGQSLLHFECCNRKVPFTNTVNEAFKIYSRVFAEYGDRAKQAESNEGIDWKALSHAIRVGEQAIELLQTGQITFPRPNAAYLLKIKQGGVPYKQIADDLDVLLTDVLNASQQSYLPEVADRTAIQELQLELYKGQVIHH